MNKTPAIGASAAAVVVALACSGPKDAGLFDGPGTSSIGTGGPSSATSGSSSADATATATTGGGASSTGDTSSVTGASGGTTQTASSGSGGATSTAASTGGGVATGGSGGTTTEGSGSTGGTGGCSVTEERCDGADNDCDDEVDEGDVCPDGCFAEQLEGRAYLFCDRPSGAMSNTRRSRDWQQAMQFCLNRDQVLAVVESEDENAFIYRALNSLSGSGDVWMGATDQEDEELWSWAVSLDPESWVPFYDADSEEPIDDAFNDWREGEPNDMGGEDCGIFEDMGSGEWLWDDRACDTEFDRLVCEETGS